jgi:hypothetical protein
MTCVEKRGIFFLGGGWVFAVWEGRGELGGEEEGEIGEERVGRMMIY